MNYDKKELKPVTEWDGNPRWMFVWNHDPKEAAVRFVCKREHGFWLARRYPGVGEKLHLYDFAAEIPQTQQTQAVDEIYDDFEQWKKEYYEHRPVEPYSVDSEGSAELYEALVVYAERNLVKAFLAGVKAERLKNI